VKTRWRELCALGLAIVIGVGARVIAIRFYIHRHDKDLVIVAVAHEWWWDFDYPALGVIHAAELHLPVGVPIHLKLVSADAFHSFWMPGLKRAVAISPNTPSELNLTLASVGHFHGNCDAGCGCSGVCMRFAVSADSAAQFAAWVVAERSSKATTDRPVRAKAAPPCVLAEAGQPASPAAKRIVELLEGRAVVLDSPQPGKRPMPYNLKEKDWVETP
jgi:heme/copper-type cytochrome/quinol oxidase subunit 2